MRNSDITYESIEHLIREQYEERNSVVVVFGAPDSDETFEAKGRVKRERTVGSQVKRQVQRRASSEVRRQASRMVRGMFGNSMVGRIARQATTTAMNQQSRDMMQGPSKSEIRNAVVDAFTRVQRNFSFDAAAGTWGALSAVEKADAADNKRGGRNRPAKKTTILSPFQQQLKSNPPRSRYERDILARFLAHLAYADGDLTAEELEFYQDSIPKHFGTVEELAKKDDISAIEAGELKEGVRETIFMLGWVISTIDMEINQKEVNMLNEYSAKFNLGADRAAELSLLARTYVLENHLDEEMNRSELFELAGKVGLTDDEAERAKIAWMKRQ